MTLMNPPTQFATVADLLDRLGDIPAERVRLLPTPGTATEQDVLNVHAREKRLCELVDGVLVEKPMGFNESLVAMRIVILLGAFIEGKKLGVISGESGMVRLLPGLVRIPDVAFLSAEKLPGRKPPLEPIPQIYPDLAVEVLSKSNTRREMAMKLDEYFTVGVRLVWIVDPRKRTVAVYHSPSDAQVLDETQTLGGEDVLPGFKVQIKQIFDTDL